MNLPDYPSWIQLETTTKCGGRCITCPNAQIGDTRPLLMSYDLVEKLLQDLAEHKDQVQTLIPFVNGEPLEDPHVFHWLEEIRDRIGPGKVLFSTNAQHLHGDNTMRLCTAMRDGTIKQLVFSVDGKQSFEAVRTGLSYEDIQYNILLFLDVLAYLELQKKINVHMTVCPENIHDLAEFVTYWENMGLRPTWMACDGRNEHALTSPSPLPCAQLLWSNLYVLSDGTCVPCCVDWQGEHPLGNLNDSTISEVWHGEAYAELREAHMQIRKADIPLCAACKASY